MTHESEFYCKTNVFSIKERVLAVKGILIRLSLLAKCFSFSGWKPVGADLYAPLKITSSITLRSFALCDAPVTFIFNVQSMSLTFNSCWVQHLLTLPLNLSCPRYIRACCMLGRPEPACHVPLMFDILLEDIPPVTFGDLFHWTQSDSKRGKLSRFIPPHGVLCFLLWPFIWRLSFSWIHSWKLALILGMMDAESPSIDTAIDSFQ